MAIDMIQNTLEYRIMLETSYKRTAYIKAKNKMAAAKAIYNEAKVEYTKEIEEINRIYNEATEKAQETARKARIEQSRNSN